MQVRSVDGHLDSCRSVEPSTTGNKTSRSETDGTIAASPRAQEDQDGLAWLHVSSSFAVLFEGPIGEGRSCNVH